MPKLNLDPKEKQETVNFSMTPSLRRRMDRMTKEFGTSRGRLLAALMDFYEEHSDDEAQ